MRQVLVLAKALQLAVESEKAQQVRASGSAQELVLLLEKELAKALDSVQLSELEMVLAQEMESALVRVQELVSESE